MVDEMNTKQKKIFSIIIFSVFLIFCGLVGYYIGKPMLKFLDNPEEFRIWVDSHGLFSRIIFIGMVIFQIIVAIIPGEPLEMGAGYAFGAIEGSILCIIGTFLGSMLVFFMVRKFGIRLVELFFSKEKIDSLKFLKTSKKRIILFFIVFIIPGTPKDILCYFAGLTDMKTKDWIIINIVGRLPSILTSTLSGNSFGDREYISALIVLGITIIISLIGIFIYKLICKINNKV